MSICEFPGCQNPVAAKHHGLRDVAPFSTSKSGIPGDISWRNEDDFVQNLCLTHHQAEGHDLFSANFGWPAGFGFHGRAFLRGNVDVERAVRAQSGRDSAKISNARRSPRPSDREAAGGVANLFLYELCERFPDHSDVGATASKLDLIGKFYLASPKRGIGDSCFGYEGSFFEGVARRLKRSSLDQKLADVRSLGRVSIGNLPKILDIHAYIQKEIVSFICEEWGVPKDRRNVNARISFCSKYLHFHIPDAFFIYDRIVRERLAMSQGVSYGKFCEHILKFASEWADRDWTPRSIDMDVYGYRDPGVD